MILHPLQHLKKTNGNGTHPAKDSAWEISGVFTFCRVYCNKLFLIIGLKEQARWQAIIAVLIRKVVLLPALAVLISWPGSGAWAGGSFAFEDLRPILNQEPVLAKWLSRGLDFDETGHALRLGQNVNPRFGGLRVGPYVILAKPKGAVGPFTLEVTVETELICRNQAGKPVDVSQAQTIKEKFSSVTVKPYKEGQ